MLNAQISPVQLPRKRASKMEDSKYVKHGTSHQIQREVEAIQFVCRHTSIPTPTVLEVYVDDDVTSSSSWFSMSEITGCPLTIAWPNMKEEARRTTQADLHKYLQELRSIAPPSPISIGSCNDGPAYDHRLNNGYPCGSFTSEAEFNDFLVAPVARCPKKELVNYYRQQLADDHGVVFTHADLCGEHILVEQSTGRITGILDWEMAGWWPSYWEYTKSRYGDRYQPWWKSLMASVLVSCERELQIEEDLQQF